MCQLAKVKASARNVMRLNWLAYTERRASRSSSRRKFRLSDHLSCPRYRGPSQLGALFHGLVKRCCVRCRQGTWPPHCLLTAVAGRPGSPRAAQERMQVHGGRAYSSRLSHPSVALGGSRIGLPCSAATWFGRLPGGLAGTKDWTAMHQLGTARQPQWPHAGRMGTW